MHWGRGNGMGWLTGSGRTGASAPRGGPSSGPRRSLSPPGDRYWVFKDNNVEEGYPRPVSDFGLPPGGIDAAFSWAHNDKTYFFKDQLYWRFDEHTRRMDPGHPARSPPWRGIPSTLDDAMRWSDGEPHKASASPPVEWGSQWACAPTDHPGSPLRAASCCLMCPRAFAPAPHPTDAAQTSAWPLPHASGPHGAAPLAEGRIHLPPYGAADRARCFLSVFKAVFPTPRMAWHTVGPQ